mgnify:CR=1 FL=1
MAYTNSVEDGAVPLEAGTTFSRGLLWAVIAVVAFVLATTFDYRWLKTLAWPIYALQLGLLVVTLLVGDGIGGFVVEDPHAVEGIEITDMIGKAGKRAVANADIRLSNARIPAENRLALVRSFRDTTRLLIRGR